MIRRARDTSAERGRLARRAAVALAAALFASAVLAPPGARAAFGFAHQAMTFSTAQAGAHPDFTVSFALNTHAGTNEFGEFVERLPDGELKDLITVLPPGLIGNPQSVGRCDQARMIAVTCPRDTTIGYATVQLGQAPGNLQSVTTRVYNLRPGPGEAAAFGFNVLGEIIVRIVASVGPSNDYRSVSTVRNIANPPGLPVVGFAITLWATPADHSGPGPLKDDTSAQINPIEQSFGGANSAQSHLAFMANPTVCGSNPLVTTLSGDSWQSPGAFLNARATSPPTTGCDLLGFKPSISVTPGTSAADSPAGLSLDLHVPQTDDPQLLATPALRKAVVSLPRGLVVNPASANGLEACSQVEIALHDDSEPQCPESSKIGTVQIDTPLLNSPVEGSVYVAKPHDNPFHSLLALYIVAASDGVLVKLAGKVDTDPVTGQLTTTFADNPQLPFEDLKVRLFGGSRASLSTPSTCGAFATTTELTPWSAPDSGPAATPSGTFAIVGGPHSMACGKSEAEAPNSPSFEAGAPIPIAGAYSPFVLRLAREDGSQRLKRLDLTLPPGLTGRLAGIPYCSDQALAVAATRTGAWEAAHSDCPAASRLGRVDVGAGAGTEPLHVEGTAYLAGPYEGAPLSLAVVTPALAGPFDLGTVVVRAALYVNPETTQITVRSDPLPTILEGIPLDIRSIAVSIDKPQFTLNPTSCNEMSLSGEVISVLDQAARLSNRFQVGGCAGLGFKPKLGLRLEGGTARSKHPALRAVLTMPRGNANIARAAVTLPHSAFLDQAHIRTVCTRVQFAAKACPKAAIYGRARAITPLLDRPLEGPVYLRSSSHNLPDLVAALRGPDSQPVEVVLDGRVDSVNGGIRNTFEAVPDAPVTEFVLEMQGGDKGLIVNSTDLCRGTHRATANLAAHNGRRYTDQPVVVAAGCAEAHSRQTRRQRR